MGRGGRRAHEPVGNLVQKSLEGKGFTTFRYDEFTAVILEFVNQMSGGEVSLKQTLRAALELYARNLPEYDAERFSEFVETEILPTVESDNVRQALRARTDRFVDEGPAIRKKIDSSELLEFVDVGTHLES
jgi:hypothetical protein